MSRAELKAAGLALLCGGLLALGLPKPGAWPLAWFCLAPLFLAWRERERAAALASGYLAGLGFHAVALFWVYHTCRFAGLPWALGVAAWLAMAAVQALTWGLVALVGREAVRDLPATARPWAWAACWTAVMAAASALTPKPAHDLLAYTQFPNLALIQLGAWGGPHALGFLIVAVNAGLAEIWEPAQRGEPAAGPAGSLALALALVAGAWGQGAYVLARRSLSLGGPTARLEILQPAVDQYQKWDAGFTRRIIQNFDELLALPRPSAPAMVVWPESAIPRWVEEGEDPPEAAAWARRLAAYQVVGVVSRGAGAAHCAALFLGPDGRTREVYFKRQLVPFGEFQPIPILERFVGLLSQMGGLTPGPAVQPLWTTPFGRAAGSICYEAMFPGWARRDAARGASLLINITNDAWYRDTWFPHQHFYANVFRAIENRVTVVRSGNTGISGVIDPWGVVTARLDLGLRGRLDAEVPLADPFPGRSLFTRVGDWPAWLSAAAVLLLLARRLSAP